MTKVCCNKIQKYGKRGCSISIPKAWLHDHELINGDLVDIYRDRKDRLVLIPRKKEISD